MPQNIFDKLILLKVEVWCLYAAGHNMNQCWPKWMSPYGMIWPQWVEIRVLFYSWPCLVSIHIMWTIITIIPWIRREYLSIVYATEQLVSSVVCLGENVSYLERPYHPHISRDMWMISPFKIRYVFAQKMLGCYWSDSRILVSTSRVTHICVSKLTIIGADNGLSRRRRKAIIWTNAAILSIRH